MNESPFPEVSSFHQARDETIGRKTLGLILESGRRAPSPGRVQSAEFIVVESDRKERLAELAQDQRLADAPTLVAVIADRERLERNLGSGAGAFAEGEAAAAVQNMRIAAERNGISSLWVGGFDRERAGEILKVPEGRDVVSIVGFAYTDNPVRQEPDFAMNDVTFYDFYDNQIDMQFESLEWKGLYEVSENTKGMVRRWVDSAKRKIRNGL